MSENKKVKEEAVPQVDAAVTLHQWLAPLHYWQSVQMSPLQRGLLWCLTHTWRP